MIKRDVNSKPVLAAILLGFLFCAISLGMVAAGRGIPAVFDGNETFSSILHARNLLTFGPEISAGLADESTSPHAQGHPVVHTHQGNFPRLYGTILFALGLTGPTAQVVATVLPIGFASVLLLFVALYRFAGLGLATASIAVLLTDYILFVQWQVVTYRLWHFSFAAALLAIAVLYRSGRRQWLLGAAFVTSLFLFYYELVFATFISVSISAFALLLWRKEILKGIVFVGAQFAGAVAGVFILITQLVAYLGWEGFITDLKLTYVSRNIGMSEPERLAALRAFVEKHHIAFFYNMADANSHHAARLALDAVFRWGLQVYTPPFVFSIVMLACGIVVALIARNGQIRMANYVVAGIAAMTILAWLLGLSVVVFLAIVLGAALVIFAAPNPDESPQRIGLVDAATLLGVPALVFLLMAGTFSQFLGFAHTFGSFLKYEFAFAITLAALIGLVIVRSARQPPGLLPLDAIVRGAALLCVAMAFSQFHHRLYDTSLALLWERALPGPFMPTIVQNFGMVLATACAVAMAVLGPLLPDRTKAPLRESARAVGSLIGCFLVGLLAVVVLFPGYVYSGYMVRYLNFLVLPFALFVGFAFYATAVIGKQVIVEWLRGRQVMFPAIARRLYLVPPVLLAVWWVAIQAADARLFPPNELAVLNAIEALAPYRPKIVANSYAGPISVVTGQWAYLDETFSSGRTTFSPASGYHYVFDKKYLWVADRDNPEYEKPDAFVCILLPTYWSAVVELTAPERLIRCADNRVVQFAEGHKENVWPHNTVIARDRSPRDAWAIVKLDWDYPPYLREKPHVTAAAKGDSASLTVTYDFRQQGGKPETKTELEIWAIARNGATCALQGAPLATAKGVGGRTTLKLARSDAGDSLIAVARPQTATRVGAPFFSAPFRLEGDADVAIGPPCDIIRDDMERNWPQRAEGG